MTLTLLRTVAPPVGSGCTAGIPGLTAKAKSRVRLKWVPMSTRDT
jgi:hypothetical protein